MRKQFSVRNSIPLGELEEYLRRWEKRAPGYVEVYPYAQSGDYPVLCARMTDPGVPDCEKERAIVVAEHSGLEVSGMNAVLGVGNLLSGLGKEAREILASQVVYLIPCHNPYSYEVFTRTGSTENSTKNQFGFDEMTELLIEYLDPEKSPSAYALRNLMDELKPEAFFDSHGVWYNDQLVIETSGNEGFSSSYRYSDQRFSEKEQEEAEKYGYHAFNMGDRQLLPNTNFWSDVSEYRSRFWQNSSYIVGGAYAYVKYHSFAGSHEVSWEESGTVRLFRALHLGSQRWEGQRTPGYPVQVMQGVIGLNSLLVGGNNAEERRNSRVELWNDLHNISTGYMHPEMPGLSAVVVSTNLKTCKKLLAGPVQKISNLNNGILMDDFLDNIDREGLMDTSGMRAQLDRHWDKVNLVMTLHKEKDWVVQNGFTIRVGIPYRDAQPEEVLLNGKALPENEVDGYTVIRHRNATYVDVHVPKNAGIDFAVAMVRYAHEDRSAKTAIVDVG